MKISIKEYIKIYLRFLQKKVEMSLYIYCLMSLYGSLYQSRKLILVIVMFSQIVIIVVFDEMLLRQSTH